MDGQHPSHQESQAPDRRPEPPRRWHPIGRIGLFLALFLGLQIVIGGPAMLAWALLAGSTPMELMESGGGAGFTLFVYALLAPVVIPFTLAFVRKMDGKTLADIGVRWPRRGRARALPHAGWALAGASAILLAHLAAVAILGKVSFFGLDRGFEQGVDTFWGTIPGPGGGVLALLLQAFAFLVQSGVEEWVFRGYVFHVLRERYSWATAAGGSSLAFALLHAPNPSVGLAALINTFLLALVLAAVVERTRSLVAVTVAHGWWNFAMAGILSLPVSGVETYHLFDLSARGADWLTGGDYGPEGSWALVALLVPAVLALAVWVDREADEDDEAQAASRDSV